MKSYLHSGFNNFFTCFIIFLQFFSNQAFAQQRKYTVANAHAHNDYLHPVPFYTAFKAGFGSIEADIFLVNNNLYVAHHLKDIDTARTLQSLYLDPLQQEIKMNHGKLYARRVKSLILLIDLKTEAEATLHQLIYVLDQYKTLTGCSDLKIIITGNQPDISRFTSFPAYLFFDGDPKKNYPPGVINKIALMSDNFQNYSMWKGDGVLPDTDKRKLDSAVKKAHALNKPIRFWGAPDLPGAWRQFMDLDVDLINTDKISEIAVFLHEFPAKSKIPSKRRKTKHIILSG